MTDRNQFGDDRRRAGIRRDLEGPRRVTEEWTVDLGGTVRTSPTRVDGAVLVGTDRALYAIDRERRHRRWVLEVDAPVAGAPAVGSDRTYVGTADGVVHALEPATGDRLWRTDLPGALESPLALADGAVVAGHAAGVSALETATGDARWTRETEDRVVGAPAVADAREWDGPRAFVATAGETVVALALGTGEDVWEVPTDGVAAAGPTVADGRAFVADDDGTLLALDVDTGQAWFSYEIDGPFTTAPTVLPDAETTFVGAADGYLHVTDTTFGRRKVRGWLFSKKGVGLDGPVRSRPVVAGDVCCVGDATGSLYGVGVDDFDVRWHAAIGDAVDRAPAVAPGRLYVASGERLVCLSWTPDDARPRDGRHRT